jgi:hypothetical protein
MSDMIPFPIFIPSSSGGGDGPNPIAVLIVLNFVCIVGFGIGAWVNWNDFGHYQFSTVVWRSAWLFFSFGVFCLVNGIALVLFLIYLVEKWLEE